MGWGLLASWDKIENTEYARNQVKWIQNLECYLSVCLIFYDVLGIFQMQYLIYQNILLLEQ
jgi:hypothetical protein